jgi:phage terminase small subunit
MDAQPNTTVGPPAVPPNLPARALTRRQENYARAVASGMSYAEAFRASGLVANTAGGQSSQIQALNRHWGIRARVAELRPKIDAETISTIAERMSWLRLILAGNEDELSRIVREPCGNCWPEAEIARAFAAHFAPDPFNPDEPRPELPVTTKPRHDCPHCRGEGYARVVLTPTDELSPAARALFKGAKQNDKGVIEIETHDKLAVADMLNKLQSAYVTRSLNLNANVAVQPARDAASAQDALRLFESFGPPA